MNGTFRNLSVLAIAFSVGTAVSPAYSQGKGKGKAKGKQDVEAKGKHGRVAGELPFGLDQLLEKEGDLPRGLTKVRNDDGSLTRGLEKGGKGLTPASKSKKKLK